MDSNSTRAVSQSANTVVALGEQVRSIVQGSALEKDAMIIAAMFQSGYYSDIQSVSQAITRAMIGQTIGLDVVRSMNNIYMTPDGKIAMEAEAIKSIYGNAGYSTRNIELTNEGCVLEWSKDGSVLGTSEFSKEDAIVAEYIDPTCIEFPLKHNIRKITKYKKGGGSYTIEGCGCKANYKKYPKDMFLARATTRGARMYADNAFGGNSIYARDEIEDIGQSVQAPAQADPAAPEEDKPRKQVRSFVKPQEAETVKLEGKPEQSKEDKEKNEKVAIVASIKSAAELLDIDKKELTRICQEISGKDDFYELTFDQLDETYKYLEEIERQNNSGDVPPAEKDAKSTKVKNADNIQNVFPGAQELPLR